jgi:hypothetical protein
MTGNLSRFVRPVSSEGGSKKTRNKKNKRRLRLKIKRKPIVDEY